MLHRITQADTEPVTAFYHRFDNALQGYISEGGVVQEEGVMLLFRAALRPSVNQWLTEGQLMQSLHTPDFNFGLKDAATYLARMEQVNLQGKPSQTRRDYGGFTEPAAERRQQTVKVNAVREQHFNQQRKGKQPIAYTQLPQDEYERRKAANLCFSCGDTWDQQHRFHCPARKRTGSASAPNGRRA